MALGFDADGWRLRHGDPAMGTLGILPGDSGRLATLDDALWLSDALAFDHDAPVGIQPAMEGVLPESAPKDPAAGPPAQPIHALEGPWTLWYWQSLNAAYGAAAELRFNGSYVVRYDPDDQSPGTNFSERFSGREELVGLYAMAARQPDLLSEYLCLYRVLEAADGRNGMTFSSQTLPNLLSRDFGSLRVIGDDLRYETAPNAFAVYKTRAMGELAKLAAEGISDVPAHLYRIRNSLAHGKHDTLTARHGAPFAKAAGALPIVKLIARMAVEP